MCDVIDSEKCAGRFRTTPAKAKAARKSKRAKPAKKSHRAKAEAKPKAKGANKKSEVIDLMRRPGGATLPEIMEATGLQKHTVRGFVSIQELALLANRPRPLGGIALLLA